MLADTLIDHLVIGAKDLESGRLWFREQFGEDIPPGGCHQRFGTHNAVMRLGPAGDQVVYVEIIAIDPEVKPEVMPRWFGLDSAFVREQLETGPKLLHWVLRTCHLHPFAVSEGPSVGELVDLQRGDLRWRMLLPQSGQHPQPLMPWMLQWESVEHPANRMAASAWHLDRITLHTQKDPGLQAYLLASGASEWCELQLHTDEADCWFTASLVNTGGSKKDVTRLDLHSVRWPLA